MKKKSMFADGMMMANDWMDTPSGQKSLLAGQALTMFMSGLLLGVNSGIGDWSTPGMLSALAVAGLWAFNLNPTLRIFTNLQKRRYEDGFDDALNFAKGE